MFPRLFPCLIAFHACLSAGESDRPNILWQFSDDHAYQAIGAYGGRFGDLDLTPNIDRIANQGMRFDRAYVGNSICAPARATLLTGKHSHMHGKVDNYTEFDHDQPQFQKLLRQNGYQTAMVGKIHLDGRMQGFDYWEVLPGQGRYWNPVFVTEDGETPDDWRSSLYYHYYEFPSHWHAVRRHEGVSTDRYKLIRFYGNDVPNGEEWEFYDLQADPHELTSAYGDRRYASEIAELKTELLRLREQYEVPDDVGGVPVRPLQNR